MPFSRLTAPSVAVSLGRTATVHLAAFDFDLVYRPSDCLVVASNTIEQVGFGAMHPPAGFVRFDIQPVRKDPSA